ncbi:O-antigen ligase family protein [Arhodomonas sp. SL1]|uniref:O-antigen ligase family protein n=1 Tax=Arhodomonas sp. SL1 TaxID=3425691 RepID=UPI003F882A41
MGRHSFASGLGILGLYLFALASLSATSLAYVGLGLLAGATAWAPQQLRARERRFQWIMAMSAVVAILVIVATAVSLRTIPAPRIAQIDEAISVLLLLAFPLIAVWTRGDERRVLKVLGLALVGLILGRLRHLDASNWQALLDGRRTGIDLTPLAFNAYTAAALVGLITLVPLLWQRIRAVRPLPGGAIAVIWLATVALCGYLTVVGRTRGVWLALAVIAAILLLWELLHLCRRGRDTWRPWAGAGTVLALTLAGLAIAWPIIEDRLQEEAQPIQELSQGNLDVIQPDNAIGIRLHMWQWGLQKVLERPVLGWGPGSSSHLLDQSGIATLIRHTDFHNGLLDLSAQVGIPATVVFGALCLAIVLTPLHAKGKNRHIVRTLVILLLLHLLTQATNFRMLNTDWRFLWLLFAGLCTGYAVSPRPEDTRA